VIEMRRFDAGRHREDTDVRTR